LVGLLAHFPSLAVPLLRHLNAGPVGRAVRL
jgi:hypothetical protein